MNGEVVCTCALSPGLRYHRGTCPVAPAQPLRVTGSEPGPEVHVRPAAYEVSLWTEDEETVNTRHYAIRVEARSGGQWAVTRGTRNLAADGSWSWNASEREGGWLATHRFGLEEALQLAREAAPHVRADGLTAAEAHAMDARKVL